MSHRILHVIRSLDRLSPADDLLTLAAALSQQPIEQSVAVLGHAGGLADEFAAAGIETAFLDQRWTYDPSTWLRLRSLVGNYSPTFIHAWDESSSRYASAAAGSQCPVITERWSAAPVSPVGWPPAARHAVTRSQRLKAELESSNTFATVAAIPPGVVDHRDRAGSREQLLEQFNLPPEAKLIGTASNLEPTYGVKELIWAADMVRVLHPMIRLLVVGDGAERPHLQRFAASAAQPENICFLGDTDRWHDIVAHLDVYWQGTAPAGVSPTALLEAMAAGVPVVASDTPQHRDWIDNGRTGHLVRAADRAQRTRLTDELLLEIASNKSMGTAGRAHALEQFSLARQVKAYVELYSVVNRK